MTAGDPDKVTAQAIVSPLWGEKYGVFVSCQHLDSLSGICNTDSVLRHLLCREITLETLSPSSTCRIQGSFDVKSANGVVHSGGICNGRGTLKKYVQVETIAVTLQVQERKLGACAGIGSDKVDLSETFSPSSYASGAKQYCRSDLLAN